jgi:thiamine kinase-like enzyme
MTLSGALLDRVPQLGGTRSISVLPGGLTNRNYRVDTADGSYVVRVSPHDPSLLAIDREHEFRNSRAAALAGVGAPVVAYLPDDGVLVIEFIDGETLTDASFSDPAILRRAVEACRRLHDGPRFCNGFDMFSLQPRYLSLVRDRGFRLPADYMEFLPLVERIRAALAARDEGTVPCNNDLLAGNFIDDGRQVWLIDYEYSGNNDACFELGNMWSECHLDLDQLAEVVRIYYGKPLRNKLARCRLQGLMSKYGWTLWASIQDSTSTLDFDFWSWGMEKYESAVAMFRGPDLRALLEDVQRAD